nr:unnamed protein product [Callosobruchus analis]
MSKHPESAVNYNLSICVHCNATYKSKKNLDDHIIRKHPDFIESISSKIHECTHCTYKTTVKGHLTEHMVQHNYKLKICVHCNAKFKSKASLDNHTVREHPDFVASVSNKLHECAHCTYKTTLKSNFSKHMWKHSKAVNSSCAHCDAKFKSKQKLDEHTLKKHPGFITSVSSKMRRCTHCTYITTRKDMFARHMLEHPETADTCIHCNAVFKRKRNLDDHIVRKHPDFIAFVSSKIHECTHCSYRTAMKANLDHHMLKHHIYMLRCLHCEATFKRKTGLDNHVIRKHPHFIASVSSKMHECTYCTYKTTMKSNFAKHLLKHRADKLMCTACNKQFRHKGKLDDHTIRKHPHLIASVTNKIHECSRCAFKTVIKATLAKHIKKHSHKLSKCIHCNAIYKHKIGLDDHILRQHPELIASVSSKMHECTHCAFKTVLKANLALHMLEHHETADRCVHCNATFKSKTALNDHTLKKHPESIGSVSSKNIYECTQCSFKTVKRSDLARHMLKHPADKRKCTVCNKAFRQKGKLDEHTVRKHPHLIASVTNKIHECTRCAFKTVMKASLARHVMKHPEIADSNKLISTEYKHKIGLDEHILRQHPELIASVSNKMHECTHCAFKTVFKDNLTVHMVEHHETADICVQCNATFKSRQGLNDHTLKKHPESIGSISSKIYECPQCTFKTVMKSYLTRHMLKHPETADRCKFSACVHCNATFKSKPSLVDHTLRKHPDSVESNSIRIYECTHCAYKTCLKRSFTKHILKHP